MRTVAASQAAGAPAPHRGAGYAQYVMNHASSHVQARKYQSGAAPVRAAETHSDEAVDAVDLVLAELKG